jgi:hypothetical protein
MCFVARLCFYCKNVVTNIDVCENGLIMKNKSNYDEGEFG